MNAIAAVQASLTGRPIEARLALTCPSALHAILAAAVPGAAPPPNTRTRLTVAAKEAGAAALLLMIDSHTGGQTHLDRQTELFRLTTKPVIHLDRQVQTLKSVIHPDRQIIQQTDR